MKYALDANIIITWWRDIYPIENFESFWAWLREQIKNKIIIICECINEEITQPPELRLWLDSIFSFDASLIELDSLDLVVSKYRQVMDCATSAKFSYRQSAIDNFAGIGDSLLIAHCAANNYCLVTNETSSPTSLSNIKIPDICNTLSVRCVVPKIMLQELEFKS